MARLLDRHWRPEPRLLVLPGDLNDYALDPERRAGRPIKHDLAGWTVTDDWPAHVPITEAEVDVFEVWFGDILDELFGPK